MSCQKNNCCCQPSSSNFVFGLILGCIIGAIVAIYFYKNNKTKVFKNLKNKLQSYFGNLVAKEKIPVIIPHQTIKKATSFRSTPTSKPRKMFKK